MAIATSSTVRTVVIGTTLSATAHLKRIALKSRRTAAASAVFMTIAFGRNRTRIADHTGINTFAIHTLFVGTALVIGSALAFEASGLGVT